MTGAEDNKRTYLVIGTAIFALITAGAVTLIIGWHFVPGLLGEWLGVIAGLISTPFFLEATFVILGFVIVIALNVLRARKDGDEFVYLEQVSGPDVPKNLPDHARWAVYKNQPLAGAEPSLLERAEGAVAIGDFEMAAASIAAMSHAELAENGVLEVRLALAQASGRQDLVARLKKEIDSRSQIT